MHTARFVFILCALQACSSNDPADGGHAHAPDAAEPFPAASAEDLQRTLDAVIAAEVSPGVSAFVERPGFAPWSGVSGVADLETGTALSVAQRFRAGSILKTAVATAVLQLVERGQLSLDAVLPELLPSDVSERIPQASAISLRMLLGHTSGLPEFADAAFDGLVMADPKHVWTFDQLLGRALENPSQLSPGAGWSYSNTNYLLLGQIMSRATGKPWRQTVREQVFARAGLRGSSLPEEGNVSCDGCSRGYEPVDGVLVDFTEVDPSMAGSSGGEAWITTPDDLARLVSGLVAGELFDDAATLGLMLDFTDAPVPEETQTGYGLGLARFQIGDVELIGHLGGTAGYQSFVFVEPVSGAVTSGFMNRRGDFGAFVLPFMDAVGRALSTPEGH